MPTPTDALAARLVQELAACRAGSDYPIRLNDLAARLDPPAEPAAVLKAVGNKAFTSKAVVALKGRIDAPAALSDDTSRLIASPHTLEAVLRAKGEAGAGALSPSKLADAVPGALKSAFRERLGGLLKGELPSFAVRVPKGKTVTLHHRDHPPPAPPEARDAERLRDLLRHRATPGSAVPLADLKEAAELTKTAFERALKQPAFIEAAMPVKPGDVFLLPDADAFVRFVSGALLTRLLTGRARTNAHAFPVKELVGLLADKVQQQTVAGLLNGPDVARGLPPDIGCVSLSDGRSGGRNVFFRLEHLRAARPTAHPVAPPAPADVPAPADFATAFDAAFARLDRERGSNNFVSLVDLRAALAEVPREVFDANLRGLRRDRRYVLASDERYDGITPEQQAAAIREEGEFLLHVSRSRQ